jgi:hypothetical protein
VFEAAVLDILDRAEEERDSVRDERRAERGRQQAEKRPPKRIPSFRERISRGVGRRLG